MRDSRRKLALILTAVLCSALVTHSAVAAPPQTRPKIRALTAFISLNPSHYEAQVADALAALKKIKHEYERAGYEVQTLRLTTQPFPEYSGNFSDEQALAFFKKYDALVTKDGLDAAIGPAMSNRGDDAREAVRLEKVIAGTRTLEGTLIIAAGDGLHYDALHAAAGVIAYLSANTAQSLGNFRFAAAAMIPPGGPFYPASYQINSGHTFAVGLQSANIVASAMTEAHNASEAEQKIKDGLSLWAVQIQAIAQRAAKESGWRFTGIDLSPAPLKEISIGGAIENYTHQPLGAPGTLSAVAIITRAVKSVKVEQTGYSGLMLPVLEDSVIARRWSEGRLSLNSLLLFSSVCATGLDVIPMPGDTSEKQIEAILDDVASLAYKWHKPLAARLLPVKGKKAGERTSFQDPFLVNAMIRAVP